ncbi:MAG: hypothetical protein GF384_02345 [Elusimicrobia bacterium]|nr:hypothetical protein [Elusimicrobiota bacterium]
MDKQKRMEILKDLYDLNKRIQKEWCTMSPDVFKGNIRSLNLWMKKEHLKLVQKYMVQ